MEKFVRLAGMQLCLWFVMVVAATGCATSTTYRPQLPFASLMHRSGKLSAEASKEDIVAHVNQHVLPIKSWRSTDVQISGTGLPLMRLPATMAVQEPNQFRLMVSAPITGQSEVDLGSNEERVWFWMHRMEPKAVLTCRHEEISAVQNHLPIPFQPDWLMEVLCVKPLDASSVDLVREPKEPHMAYLVSHHHNENGQAVRRVTAVDLKRGEITGHQLYDAEHRLVVSAELRDYRSFPNTTARLPHDITLCWTQQNMKMNLSLAGVEVNPPQMPAEFWDLPKVADCPVHELRRDHLLGPSQSLAAGATREKPKAVTQYELDAPSGVWLQNQQVVPAGATASQGQVHGSSAVANAHGIHAPSPVHASSTGQATFAENSRIKPAGLHFSGDTPPPFPTVNTQQSATAITASAVQGSRKSRDTIVIDAFSPAEFETPVKRSSAGSQ